MQHLPIDPSLLADRWAWLEAEQARYWNEPNQAGDQIAATQALFELLQQEEPSDFGVALAVHLVCLLDDDFQGHTAGPALTIGLAWAELGLGSPYRIYLLARSCRRYVFLGDGERAASLLARLTEMNAGTASAMIDRGYYQHAMAMCFNLKQEPLREIECLQEAARLYQGAGYRGPWVIVYTRIAIAYLRLDDIARRLLASQMAADLSVQQGRWGHAVNNLTGVAEASLELGDVAMAQQALSHASAYLQRLSAASRLFCEPEVLAAQANCCVAQQDLREAVSLMRQSFVAMDPLRAKTQHARRLRDLAPWLVQTGEGQEALSALEQAHALELEDLRNASQKSLTQALEKAELQHARAEQEAAQAHAKELQQQNNALAESLQLQRELQEELIASTRLASLGNLLAGVSHELNTPLGISLTTLSAMVECSLSLEQRIQAGALSRSGLVADVANLREGACLTQRNVERAIAMVTTYKELMPQEPVAPVAEQPLHAVVREAWHQALAPNSSLSLELDLPEHLGVTGDALSDVLLQLFQNVARHAYAPGQPGVVRVSAGRVGHQLWLHVQDQGRGIAADLLPRVFDPYVSTQFGQGRSGLGLFKAQAQVSKGLKGRLSAKSVPGEGARFEIEWLQLELRPVAL